MKKINKSFLLFILAISINCEIKGENNVINLIDTFPLNVLLVNPSFEDTLIAFNHAPMHWSVCENSPDTQPDTANVPFMPPPSDGNSYLGLYALQTFFEGVGQKLTDSLIANENYHFTIDVSYPVNNLSNSNYAAKIAIWLGNDLCHRGQRIYAHPPVDSVWITHQVNFVPLQNYKYFSIYTDGIFGPFVESAYISIDNIGSALSNTVSTQDRRFDDFDILIYPNPAYSNTVNIEWSHPVDAARIVIHNLLGQVLEEHSVNEHRTSCQVNTEQLASGTFVLSLESNGMVMTSRMLKIIR